MSRLQELRTRNKARSLSAERLSLRSERNCKMRWKRSGESQDAQHERLRSRDLRSVSVQRQTYWLPTKLNENL